MSQPAPTSPPETGAEAPPRRAPIPELVAGAPLAGWGRLGVPGREVLSEDLEAASRDAVLCRGLGRSYGDPALPPPSHPEVLTTTRADRILDFDPETGILRAEAGLSLKEVVWTWLERGWFPAITPGTQFVTLGGMVAADVHGKNHHRDGCFGAHVTAMKMRLADGRIVECSPTVEPDLFRATVGGMGLTGHILEVAFRMVRIPSPWIRYESSRVPNIDAYMDALKDAGPKWPYTVGWIDCLSQGRKLGRGILQRGRWAEADAAPRRAPRPKRHLSVPFVCPGWLLGRFTVRSFNAVYYRAHFRRERSGIVHPEPFFYPLDKILHWNRLYGPRGFTQYQCVLPEAAGRGAVRRFLELLTSRGGASFLCVIKDCGAQGEGLLSFPMPGTSIACDIAVRDDTPDLVETLNDMVLAEGGRIYLAKDSFTSAEQFRKMEPRWDAWMAARNRWDPERRFRSAQSIRLFGDTP